MISRGVEISIAGGGGEMVRGGRYARILLSYTVSFQLSHYATHIN